MKFNKKNQKGFTFTELLIALVLITVGILTSIGLITFSFTRTMKLSPRLTASYLTQEGVEVIRRIREDNWIGIKTCLDYYLAQINAGINVDENISRALACETNKKWIIGLLINNHISYNNFNYSISDHRSIAGRLNFDSSILERYSPNSHENFFNLYYLPCNETNPLPNCGSFHHNNPINHIGTIFRRRIDLRVDETGKQLTITITVSWTEKGEWLPKNRLITTTELYNWYPIATTP